MSEELLSREMEDKVAFARQELSEYRDKTKKSQSDIARELGISPAAVSAFLNGKYKAPQTMIPKIEALISIQETRNLVAREPGYAETNVSKQVLDTVEYCHLQGKLVVIYGDAGIGKTVSIRHYRELHPEAVLITISPAFATMSGVNDLLSEQIGVREKNARRVYAEIVSRLKNSGRVIIIDEAQHLTKKTLEHLRSISDEAGIGICLVGNEEVYSRLKGTGKADFAQIYSRIGYRKPLFLSSIKKIDVEKVFFDAHLEEDTVDFLYKISQTRYGLRGAVNVFMAASAAFEKVNASAVVRVAREMQIG